MILLKSRPSSIILNKFGSFSGSHYNYYVLNQDGATAQSKQFKEREQALERAFVANKDYDNLIKLKESLKESIKSIDSNLNKSQSPTPSESLSTSTNENLSPTERSAQIKLLEEQLDTISKRLASLEAGSRHI